MRIRCLPTFLLLLVLHIGCRRQPEEAGAVSGTPPQETRGRVHGLVFAAIGENMIPLAGIEVALRKRDSDSTIASARTDDTGLYKFARLGAGDYRLCWNVPGYRPGCTDEVLRVDNLTASAPDIMLKPAEAATALSGRVLLADGSPCRFSSELFGIEQHATVVALDSVGRAIGSPILTNSNGDFVLPGLKEPESRQVRVTCGVTSTTVLARPAATIRLPGAGTLGGRLGLSARQAGRSLREIRPGSAVQITADVPARANVRWKAIGIADEGLVASGRTASFTAPARSGFYTVYALADSGRGDYVTGKIDLVVSSSGLQPLNGPEEAIPPIPAPGTEFLTKKGIGSAAITQAYYQFIDPLNKRTTLGAWWDTVGFAADGTGGDRAAYVNTNDLGFGRDMNCIQRGDDVACYVTNYGQSDRDPANADLAWNRTAPAGATVAMEYAPIEGLEGRGAIVKFFVYDVGVSRASSRIEGADLDDNGVKHVPQLCLTCHGGDYEPIPNQVTFEDVSFKASFREFDLPTLQYPGPAPRATQEAAFYKLNQTVLATRPSKAIADLIAGWYSSGTTADDSYVPAGWRTDPGHPALYRTVTATSCRTCHVAFGGDAPGEMSWMTYAQFRRKRLAIRADVCLQHTMPHAKITYENFWTASPSRADFLGNFTAADWTALGPCQ